MKEDPKVIVVGCASQFFEIEEGFSVTQEGIKRYLEQLDDNFASIEYFSEKGYGSSSPLCLLDIDRERLHTQSTSNFIYFLFDLILNHIKIFRHSDDKELISLVYVPGMFSFLLAPYIIYNSDRIILYYMSDPRKVIWENPFPINKIKDIVYSYSDKTLQSNADAILYRDNEVIERAPQSVQLTQRSKPIMSLDISETFVRGDTCDSEPITILYVGSIIKRKGVSYLVRAFNRIQDQNETNFKLRIVGDGDKREEIVSLCEELGVRNSVEFTGHICKEDQLLKEYRESDIFVLPSLEEGFPRVITEAMSQGLPVITTRVGEIDKRLNGNTAIIIEPGSINDIVISINELITNEYLRKELISNGRDYAEEMISISAADQHISIIKSLTNP